MEAVFIRHGESQANAGGIIQGRSDHKLSSRGRDQAMRTADALIAFQPYLVYTSPLARARETAEIINRRHNAEIRVMEELTEYDLGEFEGLTMDQVIERFPRVIEQLKQGTPFHHLAPGAETDEQADRRAAAALEQILDSGLPRVIVVAHLGILERMILKIASDLKMGPAIESGPWPLRNCSITRLDLHPLSPKIISFNNTDHL